MKGPEHFGKSFLKVKLLELVLSVYDNLCILILPQYRNELPFWLDACTEVVIHFFFATVTWWR